MGTCYVNTSRRAPSRHCRNEEPRSRHLNGCLGSFIVPLVRYTVNRPRIGGKRGVFAPRVRALAVHTSLHTLAV